jgi:CubicO group peptidase (beta-lactamase class C family)
MLAMTRIGLVLLTAMAPAQPAQPAAPTAVPRALLEVGAGYAAKVIGSGVFVSGRSVESILAEEFAPDTPLDKILRPLLRVEVDRARGTLTVHAGDVARTVVHRDGLGCTLALGVEPATLRQQTLPELPWPADLTTQPWPVGDVLTDAPPPAGTDMAAIRAAVDEAFREEAAAPIRTRAVVVVHRGRLLLERYADGFHRDMALAGWSMTKSVVNALVGIRVRQGKVKLDEPVPVAAWQEDDDPRRALTWRVLLQMSSGLQWQENYVDPTSHVPRMLFCTADAAGLAAQSALARAPGTRWQYASGTTNILSAALRTTLLEATEYLAFARDELFAKLGMRSAVLEPDTSGTFIGSSFMFATARDWARFGLLYLHDGVWNGERILPEGWVHETTTPAPKAPKGRYGLHWWLNAGEPDAPERRPAPMLPKDMFAANGYQGQTLVVIPSRQFVAVRLACSKDESVFDERTMLAAILRALPE